MAKKNGKGAVSVGDVAPDFRLPGTGGREYALSDYRGRVVVLVFYPGDDTPVCTRQLVCYSNELAQFAELDAQVLAVSTQDVASHEAFAAKHRLTMPLLADVDKNVHRGYGVLGVLDLPRRSVFVIDAGGVVRYAHRAVVGVTFRPVDELTAAVRAAR
jgi:peroxiredoxin Q/BCP